MITFYKNHWRRSISFMLIAMFAMFTACPFVLALSEKGEAIQSMKARQEGLRLIYDKLNERIHLMEFNDPKKEGAKEKMKTAKSSVDYFNELDPDDIYDYYYDEDNEDIVEFNKLMDNFDMREQAAQIAINDVNLYLIKPFRPGVDKEGEGGVPEGRIVEDFIPQFIRILFRFASLAVLISFVVSGIMLVVSFDNEERVTKAKQMLYYSLVGFAFVTLAFAIVKAVTDIDFFGFIP